MSLQWTLAAGFLYAEMVVVLLLIFPIISAKRLNNFFKSNFMRAFSSQAAWYFGFIILVLGLFLLDAIREIRKYSGLTHNEAATLQSELQTNMRLFRSQRNLYISGFSLFLSLVIRQLVRLISKQAVLLAENEAALKQAKSATTTARSLLSQTGGGEAAQNTSNEAHQKEVSKLKKEIESLKNDLEKSKTDSEALISQSKSLEREYDRLNEEHRKLQLKLSVKGEDKKDD